jgi:serine/threonine-protein kinase
MSRQSAVLVEDDYDDERGPARTSTYIIILAVLLAILGGMLFLLARTLGVGGDKETVVPSVIGDTQTVATKKLKDAGLNVDVKNKPDAANPAGQVLEQAPTSGVRLKRGATVTITVAGQPEQVTVPNVVNKNFKDATDQLDAAGFTVKIERRTDDKVNQDVVIEQAPKANEKAARGSAITLVVSNGPEQVTVPSLFNAREEDAASQLTGLGLQVERTTSNDPSLPAGRVIRTDPGAGTPVPKGSTVTLVVSSGPPPTTAAPATTSPPTTVTVTTSPSTTVGTTSTTKPATTPTT